LGNEPLHVISIRSYRFSWPREFLSEVLMLFMEENCHQNVDMGHHARHVCDPYNAKAQ